MYAADDRAPWNDPLVNERFSILTGGMGQA